MSMEAEVGDVVISTKSNDSRKQIRKAERDPWNRILSIIQDAEWVINFCQKELPDIPIVPNLRCGAWYVPNRTSTAHKEVAVERGCYFKSTDGHANEWGFSLKRYNPSVLSLIQERGACIVVDSTRRGKSMPDALSKTIPIWCAVINEAARYTYNLSSSFKNTFRIADHVISDSERDQIKSRIDGWVEDLLDSHLQIPKLEKPLMPIFVSRSHVDAEIENIRGGEVDFHPVILISASPMVSTPDPKPKQYIPQPDISADALGLDQDVEKSRRNAEYVYVQGSGDDEEMWSCELTPKLLWRQDNLRQILQTRGDAKALQHCLETIVLQERLANMTVGVLDTMAADVQIGPFGLWFGRRGKNHTFSQNERGRYGLIIHSDGEAQEDEGQETGMLKLGLESGKRGLHEFRKCITKVIAAAQASLPRHILICSSESDGIGYDLNGSLAICILATCFDEEKTQLAEFTLQQDLPKPHIPADLIKDDIQKRLQWITTFVPQAKPPSRKHILRINEILLSQDIRADMAEQRNQNWM
jgi:tRNA A64-2'-O-ribosylphosphate transferase